MHEKGVELTTKWFNFGLKKCQGHLKVTGKQVKRSYDCQKAHISITNAQRRTWRFTTDNVKTLSCTKSRRYFKVKMPDKLAVRLKTTSRLSAACKTTTALITTRDSWTDEYVASIGVTSWRCREMTSSRSEMRAATGAREADSRYTSMIDSVESTCAYVQVSAHSNCKTRRQHRNRFHFNITQNHCQSNPS